jgi:hypothetical protein
MNRKVIAREGLVFLATGAAFVVLAVILPVMFKIELWPILTTMPFAPIVPLLYVMVRWIQCKRRGC